MEDWKEILRETDEDYLIGISNKGIVKRAYKDKEEGNYEVLSFGSDAIVRVGGKMYRLKAHWGKASVPALHALFAVMWCWGYWRLRSGWRNKYPKNKDWSRKCGKRLPDIPYLLSGGF